MGELCGGGVGTQDITELSRQLRELQRECAAASVAAASVLNVQSRLTEDSPPAEGQLSISELVDQLVALFQACTNTNLAEH